MISQLQGWRDTTIKLGFFSLALMAFLLPITESGTDIAYLLSVFFILISGVVWRQRAGLYKHPVNLGLLLLAAMMVIGLIYSSLWFDPRTVRLLRAYIWMLFTPCLILAITEEKQRRLLLHAFLWGNAVVLICSLGKLFPLLWGATSYDGQVFRIYLMQNFFMAFASAFWLVKSFFQNERRLLWLCLFVLSSVDVFLVKGRTGYLVWFLLVFYILYRQLSWKHLVLSCCGVAIFLGLLAVVSPTFMPGVEKGLMNISHYVNKTNTNQVTSMGVRSVQLASGLAIIKQHPWVGVGTGGSPNAYGSLQANTANEKVINNYLNSRTDSTYINVMVEHGLVGLALLLGFIMLLWVVCARFDVEWCLLGRCLVIGYFSAGIFTAFLISSFAVHFLSLMLVVMFGGISMGSVRTLNHID